MEFDPCQAWYHGSPLQLRVLPSGSTITSKITLARVFSHKPSVVSISDRGMVKHNGTLPGFLYIVSEEVRPEDILQHPHSTLEEGGEWLTTRDLTVHLLTPTQVRAEELLTDEELARLLSEAEKRLK